MNLVDRVRAVLPEKYRQFSKFLIVGGFTWVIDTGLFLILRNTILSDKVLTAKIIPVLIAMIVNYVLNREWSFAQRGGREKAHEALLFFLLNGIGLLINLVPLWISHYLLGFNLAHYSTLTVNIVDVISGSIIGTILAMAFRYWAYKKWVFPEVKDEESAHLSEGNPGSPRGTS
ncbi:GtrA family protein [Nakamurella antarctica]|uniref:GtrA family protein n=1 Tax=Nakamurella antarctica TaxID=1902245 RepID=A0A3G8ZVQ5_9ACTN|nr:GtrA family protein [Nakamurella antarctica]AZI58544.1 GtrA family protein [Nakamurella antarctica]